MLSVTRFSICQVVECATLDEITCNERVTMFVLPLLGRNLDSSVTMVCVVCSIALTVRSFPKFTTRFQRPQHPERETAEQGSIS